MYSNIKSVQLVVALLKKYDLKNVVLSPGGSDIPIIHSIETDSFFECYSIVDERSAVYFAMGLAQTKNEPVVCVCTSGTAVSNFLPGITEAYHQSVPIVALTADKNPHYTYQLETQKTNQTNIFGELCKKSVDLPIIHTEEDSWYCERLICEALFELTHHGNGPVHINIPIIGETAIYNQSQLPNVKDIKLMDLASGKEKWSQYIKKLENAKRILLVVGQNVVFKESDVKNVEKFFSKYNCMISVEHMSNLKCEGCVYTYPITETKGGNLKETLLPDIVISFGNNMASYCLKPFLRRNASKVEHWSVDEAGRVRDVFNCLQTVFECSPSYFFEYFAENASSKSGNDKQYYMEWKNIFDSLVYPEFNFSNFYVAQQLSKRIPANSVLHMAILNSTRIMQFFELDKTVRSYSNIGALGIDGCLSTFMGHANATKELAFCVIGDLSFFYDMNAAGIRHVGKNVRIILLNNGGGSEFHFFMGKKNISTINDYICAEQQKVAEGWIKSLGYQYYSATSKEELNQVLPEFTSKSDGPKFLEVFTNMEDEARFTHEFYDLNNNDDLKAGLKNVAKSVLSAEQLDKAKKFKSKFLHK